MSLTSVNLLWQRRYRGLLPAGGGNLAEDGMATLVRPDPVEPRTYQVLQLAPGGDQTEVRAVSVETIRAFEVLPDASLLLGTTADDLYLFHEGRKTRFQPDRRVVYADVALAASGAVFVGCYSDSLFSSHGVVFADTTGRLLWHRDLSGPVNRVSISGDGRIVVLGMQEGRLMALDQRRNPMWECIQDEPVTALAQGASGTQVVVGTDGGSVFLLDEEGGFRWKASLGLPVLAVAGDAGLTHCAAVAGDAQRYRLVCMGSEGVPVWELDLEVRPTGVTMSANGRYLLVTFKNGGASLFEVQFSDGSRLGAAATARLLEQVNRTLAVGEFAAAREPLAAALQQEPHRVDLAEALLSMEEGQLAILREQAEARQSEGDLSGALASLRAARELRPWDAELFQEAANLRSQLLTTLATRAEAEEQERSWDRAGEVWSEVLALDPQSMAARTAVQRLLRSQAQELTAEGDDREQAGDMEAAVRLWQRARELADTPELTRRLEQAEIRRCFAAGMAFYEAERMPEAQFQFRKVLTLDPYHEEAQRYLGYSLGQTAERSLISDRFSRLE